MELRPSSSEPAPKGIDADATPPGATVPRVRSEDLFQGQTELRILHRGEEYRLRITRQGKLILTK